MQENKLNSVMNEVKKLKENKGANGGGALGGRGPYQIFSLFTFLNISLTLLTLYSYLDSVKTTT